MRAQTLVAAALMTLGTTGAGFAATFNVTYDTEPPNVAVGPAALDISGDVEVKQWDPSMFPTDAVLTNIKLTFEYDITEVQYETGIGLGCGVPCTGNVSSTEADGAYIVSTATFDALLLGQDPEIELRTGFFGPLAVTPPEFRPAADQQGMTMINLNIADANWNINSLLYIGAGNASIGVDSNTITATAKSPGILDGANGIGAAFADVTYTYTVPSDVPVPAALPLLATALGGFGFMTWRRKRA